MGSEATTSYTAGSDDPLLYPLNIDAFFAQTPDGCDLVDLLRLDESAGHIPPDPQSAGHIWPDPQSAGDTSHSTIAGLPEQAALYDPVGLAGPTAVAENLPEQNAHRWFDWTGIQPPTYSIIGNAGRFTSTGMAEIPHAWSPLLGFNMPEIWMSAENPPQEPSPLVVNAGLATPEPDPYSNGDSSCPSTTADMGISTSPDLEVHAGSGDQRLHQSSGGGALTEAPVRVSCKRKGLFCGSSIQTPPEFNLEEFISRWGSPSCPRRPLSSSWASIWPVRPQESHIKPPTGSTDHEIICFLRQQEIRLAQGDEVNVYLGMNDKMFPKAVRSYVTTVEMADQSPCPNNHGYWKEKQVKPLGEDESDGITGFWQGLKRTFQFHSPDGTKTNWFMHEYIPTNVWGSDLYMKGLRFREVVYEEVHEAAEVPVRGEPTSPEVKIKNKTAAAKKHRMRGPENLVIKGESPAWQHFSKIYDKHPELEGSKVVYAVCCHCEVVLKARTENGTKSLLTHCDRTCPVKNKKQQPSSSSPDSTGDTSCLSTAADTGSSPLDQDFNAGAGLPQSGGGGGALGETPVRASCKRKKLVCGSSSQMSTLPEHNLLVELLASLVQSDPSSTDIKPPTSSTDIEIIRFLEREDSSMQRGKEVNLSLGEQDQMAPEAVRSYVTTVKMMPDQNPHDLGYWKEKEVKHLRDYEFDGIIWSLCRGLKRTLQFHKYDGTKTNWFMHEYIPTDLWGRELFMKPLRFREVYEGAEVPGEPTSPEGKIKNKNSAAKKHRMRGPKNMVIEKESRAWQHFIKIYDKYPELEGSKVVYAVCCHCEGVLKASTGNGTKSLLTHCDRTCPVKNKKEQPSSSSYQENIIGVLVGVGVP